jgi:hypothetical protein
VPLRSSSSIITTVNRFMIRAQSSASGTQSEPGATPGRYERR